MAAAGGCDDIVKKILEKGGNPNDKAGYYSVLGTAACYGQMETAKLLISKGGDIDTTIYGLKEHASINLQYLSSPDNRRAYDRANLGIELLKELKTKPVEPKVNMASEVTNEDLTPIVQTDTEKRTALVIGNSQYDVGRLKNPVNDATDIASSLRRHGFAVVLKKNARQQEMEEAIRNFGRQLKRGGVGLFFYAGHGVQINGRNYLIPIGDRIEKETDAKYQAIDAEMVLDEMASAGNPMNIVILDACRDNPLGRSLRSAGRGLAIISDAPRGTFITYSTSPGKTAADGDGRNSPYTAALLKSISEPGLPIEQLFKKVRQRLSKETGNRQIPWELSSLQGDFYFTPGRTNRVVADIEDKEATPIARPAGQESYDVSMGKRPSVSTANEIRRDGRFIAYDNGTVLDTNTNLMWAAKNNGYDINWADAKRYCKIYQGGGYTDWRMPTQDELAGLYDAGKSQQAACLSSYQNHVATDLINLTCFAHWASETRGSDAARFDFGVGNRAWVRQSYGDSFRALPVRTVK
jgi:hypothetical protein